MAQTDLECFACFTYGTDGREERCARGLRLAASGWREEKIEIAKTTLVLPSRFDLLFPLAASR
jgi:hypothetical protein